VDDNAEGKAEHVKCHIKPYPIRKLNESDRKMGDRKISGGVLGPVSWFVAGEWGAGAEVTPWCALRGGIIFCRRRLRLIRVRQ
jgi:hypothetical protein